MSDFTENKNAVESNDFKKHQLYQINPGFILRQIGGESVIIPVSEDCAISNAVMNPNESAVFLWNEFLNPKSEEDAVMSVLAEFDGPEDQIRHDVHCFVVESLRLKVLREVD
ncbi:MAG: PqqD family protein [Fusicatenibacter sp.]|nr:PqqD family protein [Fusicatenibacter sp.]